MGRHRLRGGDRPLLSRTRALLAVTLALVGCASSTAPARPTAVDVAVPARALEATPVSVIAPLRALPAPPPLSPAESDALDVLVARLRDAKSHDEPDLLDVIGRRFGARGLVRALRGSVPASPPEVRWFRQEQLFAVLERLADPGGADDLVTYIGGSDDVHFRGRAALVLAQLGDLRAAEALARRLRSDPIEVYARERYWEAGPGGHLSRTDQSRIDAVRGLVDLARLHPDRREHFAKVAAEAVIAWAEDRPAPHAHAMRFLALVRAPEAKAKLTAWAMPEEPLPEPGTQPPFPSAFETAQSALRALGQSGDAAALADLERQLLRKEEALDISMESLTGQGIVMRGMALRALAFGAAQGLSELGDERAATALERVVRDGRQNEEARVEACEALVWCTSDARLSQLATDLPARAAAADPSDAFHAACIMSVLPRRTPSEVPPQWTASLRDAQRPAHAAAALFAVSGTGSAEAALLADLGHAVARPFAAAALLLGGSSLSTKQAAAAGAADPLVEHELFQIVKTISFVTDAHLQRGTLLRWGRRFRDAGEPTWMRKPLEAFFDQITIHDTGPHSLTRVVLRRRLVELAVHGSAAEREDAKTILAFMKEHGALDYVSRLPL